MTNRPRASADSFGPLSPYLDDPRVTDLFVNGHERLWVDRGGGAEREASWSCPSEARLREFAVRLVSKGGRHIDEAAPCVDVRVEGFRVHVVLPPVATAGTLISVRVPQRGWPSLDELAARGLFGAGVAADRRREVVERAVRSRTNVLVTGAGGSGKTTFLSAFLAAASPADRIVVIEDVAELRIAHPHVVALEARQPNLEGAGGIGLAELVRQALRMRPDRLVLGECRGAELRELLAALNTGHDGGAGTLHANAIADVPARLEALGALAGLDATAVARQAVSAIGLVCHLRQSGRRRGIEEFGRFALDGRDRLRVVPLSGLLEAPEVSDVSEVPGVVGCAVPRLVGCAVPGAGVRGEVLSVPVPVPEPVLVPEPARAESPGVSAPAGVPGGGAVGARLPRGMPHVMFAAASSAVSEPAIACAGAPGREP
ncbi:TadA family conjugal transfer-associated ATPase [Herbiconiux sp. 11R-BC]|uniref:TadA family conjugal transfer-associated ATPase n=1 Tax=Herbiconiux sp. 11R-BC TaxID=3111637 RepID=UPI003C04D9F0